VIGYVLDFRAFVAVGQDDCVLLVSEFADLGLQRGKERGIAGRFDPNPDGFRSSAGGRASRVHDATSSETSRAFGE
jgi:hypothetical protein